MRCLIVNGDDFGASRGINRGILEAYRRGILTSASLMVDRPASEEAGALGRAMPDLSLGLHADLDDAVRQPANCADWRSALHRQAERFWTLVGRPPTHLDSHHNLHRMPWLLPLFAELAQHYRVPLRGHSPIRCVSSFYGQWGGETHPEQVGVEGLIRILATDVHSGVTELCCHPGYVEPDFPSSYGAEREMELRTLCHPAVREALEQQRIRLVSFRAAEALVGSDA